MNVIRSTVKLHTIDEWMALDESIRSVILQNIKIKDRLWKWLKAQQKQRLKPLDNPKWVPCQDCEQKGWVLKEPRYPGIHPSQIISECQLKIFWDMLGKEGEETHDARVQLIFDLGSAVHRMFQGYGLKGAWGPHYKPEVTISPEHQKIADDLMLEGHADADNLLILDDIPNAPIYEVGIVHEYKTINSNGFSKLTRPKSDHKIQATIYSAALNRPIVVYLYFNKDDSNVADFPVPFEHDIWNTVSSKASSLKKFYDRYQEALEQKRDPEYPPANAGFGCKDCSYSKNCHAYTQHLQQRRA